MTKEKLLSFLTSRRSLGHLLSNFTFCHNVFQLYSIIVLSFIESFHTFNWIVFKVFCCLFVVCGQVLNWLSYLAKEFRLSVQQMFLKSLKVNFLVVLIVNGRCMKERVEFKPFPHIDAFWILRSRWLLKSLWQKENLPLRFQLYSIIILSFIEIVYILYLIISKSSATD